MLFKLNHYVYWFLCCYFSFFVIFNWGLLFIFGMKTFCIKFLWSILYTLFWLNFFNILFCLFFISSMVVLYSSDYMGIFSYSSNRFLFLVILFIVSMILMIMSPNLLSILLGWDGLSMVSYCLVIYYNSLWSYLSGMITCLTNRMGDIGLLISICWLMSYGSWQFKI